MFRKLLIANRGEIACRIARTAHRLGLEVAAVYSRVDAGARHVRLADEAWPLAHEDPRAGYLDGGALIGIARECGAQAIHPGYGFLSENAAFSAACAAAGVSFVGPPAAAISAMGSKSQAKTRMQRAGVPVLPGYQGEDQTPATLEREALTLGFPLIVKPSGGGGGKGMQIVLERSGLNDALQAARRIATGAFADSRLLLERYLPSPRHIEVQLLADAHGRILHIFDRDCSVQRRHQKLIEEAPAPHLSEALRAHLGEAAVTVAREIGYVGAGTVEFLVEGDEFFFLEMNTRLQVEHAVTEAITGLDLVEWQLRIAAGEPLTLSQSQLRREGHAIEARVCAEDPAREFLPAAGRLACALWPEAQSDVRVDYGFESGDRVPSDYDSLLGKVIARAPSRRQAIERLHAALAATRIAGVPTNVAWLARALEVREFGAGQHSTAFIDRHGVEIARASSVADPARLAAYAAAACALGPLAARTDRSPWALLDGFHPGGAWSVAVSLKRDGHAWSAEVRVLDEKRAVVQLHSVGAASVEIAVAREETASAAKPFLGLRQERGGMRAQALVTNHTVDVWCDLEHASFATGALHSAQATAPRAEGSLTTSLPGIVVSVQVVPGARVAAGDPLLVVEAMKMEHTIRAPHAGIVKSVRYRVGDRVQEGSELIELGALPDA